MQLPATSEWLCTQTGLLRSQYASLAVDQLATSIASILSTQGRPCYHDSEHPSEGVIEIPPQVLTELSEMCIPILHYPEALVVVEALLKCRPITPVLSDLGEDTTACGLSPKFLEAVTALQKGGESGYGGQPAVNLGYEARTNLWRRHLPSFEQELLDLVETVRAHHSSGDTVDVKTILHSRELPKACVEYPQLFIFCEEFFRWEGLLFGHVFDGACQVLFLMRVLIIASHAAPMVVRLVENFNSSLLAARTHTQLKILVSVTVPQFDVQKWISVVNQHHSTLHVPGPVPMQDDNIQCSGTNTPTQRIHLIDILK